MIAHDRASGSRLIAGLAPAATPETKELNSNRMEPLLTILLGPLLYLQGRYVRLRVPRLPEPPGARQGVVGDGPPLRLLIIGDSAAAGVGADSQNAALAGQLVTRLGRHYRIDWRLEARTGATTRQTLMHLRRIARADQSSYDVLLTSLGVNDITRNTSEAEWLARQQELRDFARQALGVRLLIVTAVPPIGRFPALPHPLRWYLGRRAARFNHQLRQALMAEPAASLLDLHFPLDQRAMAPDGFHPGPEIYAAWAELAANLIRENFPTQ